MREFPRQFLDVGKSVYFGQSIQEVEQLFVVPAVDNPLQIARKGIDRKISTPEFSLKFDREKLHSIEFRQSFRFDYPPQPFAEQWANFAAIEGACIEKSMTRDRFADYIRSWEIRAKQSGAISVDSPDLAKGEFRYSFEKKVSATCFISRWAYRAERVAAESGPVDGLHSLACRVILTGMIRMEANYGL